MYLPEYYCDMKARICTSLFSGMCKNNWRTKIQPAGKKFGKNLEFVIFRYVWNMQGVPLATEPGISLIIS